MLKPKTQVFTTIKQLMEFLWDRFSSSRVFIILFNKWCLFDISLTITNKLDWGSIRSSPRDGSSTFNWLTKGWLGFGGWLGVVGWVVGPQYFCVIPWHFENGASIRLMMFLLKMVDYSMSFLSLSTSKSQRIIVSATVLFLGFWELWGLGTRAWQSYG